LLRFVEFKVKLINFDGVSKSTAVILDFGILQGSVATQLRWGGRTWNGYIDSFLGNLSMKKIIKIDQHLPKLWSKVMC